MEKLLISGCLLGYNCKYNGGNNYNPLVEELKKKYELVIICPEAEGGLTTPRNPSEIRGDKVVSNQEVDVTKEFMKGAEIAYNRCKEHDCHKALLKQGSPSCGTKLIYDGTFTGKKIPGEGMTVRLLKKLDVKFYSENEIESLLQED